MVWSSARQSFQLSTSSADKPSPKMGGVRILENQMELRPERGVKAQRSMHGYTVQAQYGFFCRREMIRIAAPHLATLTLSLVFLNVSMN